MRLIFLFALLFLFQNCETPSASVSHETIKSNSIAISIKTPEVTPNRYNVAFLIMDGVFNTELTAPFDIFQHTIFRKNIKPMNVFLVADTHEPVVSFEGMRILPDFNYLKDKMPKFDILVVPSADQVRNIIWIQIWKMR